MPVDDTNDEFDRLAVKLNEMMDRIDPGPTPGISSR